MKSKYCLNFFIGYLFFLILCISTDNINFLRLNTYPQYSFFDETNENYYPNRIKNNNRNTNTLINRNKHVNLLINFNKKTLLDFLTFNYFYIINSYLFIIYDDPINNNLQYAKPPPQTLLS